MLRDFWDDIAKPVIAIVLLVCIGVLAAWLAVAATSKLAHASPQARYAALKQIEGLHERKHRKALQARLGVNPAKTAWCGYAVAYSVKKAHQTPVRGYPSARSWEEFGTPVRLSQARKGDIVTVYSRRARSKRHVGLYSHRSQGKVCLIGGNQSNRVKVSCYSAKLVRAVRR